MTEFAADWLGHIQPYFVEYGFWLILALLFLKSLIFLAPIMPGASVLVLAGGLARHGQGSLYLLALSGFIGTVAGDTVSYFIGQKAGHRLLRSKRWGKSVTSVSERVRKEPALLVFCHFETILRMLVPATAGMSGVPFRRWLLLNAAGSALWVAAYMAAGYFLSFSGALAISEKVGPIVLLLVVAIVGGRYLMRRHARQKASSVRDVTDVQTPPSRGSGPKESDH